MKVQPVGCQLLERNLAASGLLLLSFHCHLYLLNGLDELACWHLSLVLVAVTVELL